MFRVEVCVIFNFGILFGNKIVNFGVSGCWDFCGFKFIEFNLQLFKLWGICVIQDCCDQFIVVVFYKNWFNIYKGYGGWI